MPRKKMVDGPMEKLIVRVTPDEKHRIEEYAAKRGESLTNVTREWVRSLPATMPETREIAQKVASASMPRGVKTVALLNVPSERRDGAVALAAAFEGGAKGTNERAIEAVVEDALGYGPVTVSRLGEAAMRDMTLPVLWPRG